MGSRLAHNVVRLTLTLCWGHACHRRAVVMQASHFADEDQRSGV